ncbi:MAG: sporulation protein YtfJ, partial [Clostridia bacterium]|nr:sporulation protein YtfJ [Clostridia bacterium]
MPHPIETIIASTMENLKNIIRVDTVVGDPIRLENDTLVLPVSRVSLGFVSGGGEYPVNGKSIANCKNTLDGGETRLPFA